MNLDDKSIEKEIFIAWEVHNRFQGQLAFVQWVFIMKQRYSVSKVIMLTYIDICIPEIFFECCVVQIKTGPLGCQANTLPSRFKCREAV